MDLGYIDHDHQVGQTGTTVRPALYIACGISGAVQHRAGMQESAKILAINTDRDAPMVTKADYAVIGAPYIAANEPRTSKPSFAYRLSERL